MAITDINISEQLQTDAPSIKYTGNEGPQASPQHQQEQMIAQQIWEALSPEQQGQFQSFEQFFQSGVWKQILQQMQQDEAQQGIGSLGPEPMEQMPNRMGAQYGGRMGYQGGEMVEGMTEGIEKVGRGGSEIIEGMTEGSVDIIEKIKESVAPFMDEAIWIEKLIDYIRKKRGEGRPDPREEITREEIIEQLRPRDPIHPMPMRTRDPDFRRPKRPQEEIEEIGIESLRGNI